MGSTLSLCTRLTVSLVILEPLGSLQVGGRQGNFCREPVCRSKYHHGALRMHKEGTLARVNGPSQGSLKDGKSPYPC